MSAKIDHIHWILTEKDLSNINSTYPKEIYLRQFYDMAIRDYASKFASIIGIANGGTAYSATMDFFTNYVNPVIDYGRGGFERDAESMGSLLQQALENSEVDVATPKFSSLKIYSILGGKSTTKEAAANHWLNEFKSTVAESSSVIEDMLLDLRDSVKKIFSKLEDDSYGSYLLGALLVSGGGEAIKIDTKDKRVQDFIKVLKDLGLKIDTSKLQTFSEKDLEMIRKNVADERALGQLRGILDKMSVKGSSGVKENLSQVMSIFLSQADSKLKANWIARNSGAANNFRAENFIQKTLGYISSRIYIAGGFMKELAVVATANKSMAGAIINGLVEGAKRSEKGNDGATFEIVGIEATGSENDGGGGFALKTADASFALKKIGDSYGSTVTYNAGNIFNRTGIAKLGMSVKTGALRPNKEGRSRIKLKSKAKIGNLLDMNSQLALSYFSLLAHPYENSRQKIRSSQKPADDESVVESLRNIAPSVRAKMFIPSLVGDLNSNTQDPVVFYAIKNKVYTIVDMLDAMRRISESGDDDYKGVPLQVEFDSLGGALTSLKVMSQVRKKHMAAFSDANSKGGSISARSSYRSSQMVSWLSAATINAEWLVNLSLLDKYAKR